MAVNDETRMTFEEVIAKIEQIKRESLENKKMVAILQNNLLDTNNKYLKEHEERVKLEKQIEHYQWLLSVNGIIVEEDDLK
jgi:hypothetical protein